MVLVLASPARTPLDVRADHIVQSLVPARVQVRTSNVDTSTNGVLLGRPSLVILCDV